MELYKKIMNGLWDEYCRLCKEVKELVREKKLNIWRKVVKKVSRYGSMSEFGVLDKERRDSKVH